MPSDASAPPESCEKLISTASLSADNFNRPPVTVADTSAMPSSCVASEFSVVSLPFSPSRSSCTSVLVVRPLDLFFTCTTKLPLLGGNFRPLLGSFSATVGSSTALLDSTLVSPCNPC